MMTTDDLIASLSAEASPIRPGFLRRGVLAGLAGGGLATLLTFAAFWGLRPDLAQALAVPVLAAKSALPALLALLGLPLVLSRARPGGRSRLGSLIWALPLALAAIVAVAFVATPPTARLPEFLGASIGPCLASIPALSAPILAGLLTGLRRGAPEHPARCGALAGLAAGGAGAAIYSLHCIEDSPLFYGTWYVLAIALVAGLGALAGRWLLRW